MGLNYVFVFDVVVCENRIETPLNFSGSNAQNGGQSFDMKSWHHSAQFPIDDGITRDAKQRRKLFDRQISIHARLSDAFAKRVWRNRIISIIQMRCFFMNVIEVSRMGVLAGRSRILCAK